MNKGRLEAFSDGVIAILITIMVLELRPPHGSDWTRCATCCRRFSATPELRLPRHLLEQSSSHAQRHRARERRRCCGPTCICCSGCRSSRSARRGSARTRRAACRRRSTECCSSCAASRYDDSADDHHPTARAGVEAGRVRSASDRKGKLSLLVVHRGDSARVRRAGDLGHHLHRLAAVWLVPDRRIEKVSRAS